MFFTGRDTVCDACRRLCDAGCCEVVVHRGAKGAASYTTGAGWMEVPAAPVDEVVCSTGSGDVFCAAHMLLEGLATEQRLSAAARIASDPLGGRRVLIPRLKDSHDKT